LFLMEFFSDLRLLQLFLKLSFGTVYTIAADAVAVADEAVVEAGAEAASAAVALAEVHQAAAEDQVEAAAVAGYSV